MNAADEKQVKDAQEKQRAERELELNDLRFLLSTPEGVRFFRRMFKFNHMEAADLFTGNSQTFFNLGERQFALKYWNDVKAADMKAFVEIITGGLK